MTIHHVQVIDISLVPVERPRQTCCCYSSVYFPDSFFGGGGDRSTSSSEPEDEKHGKKSETREKKNHDNGTLKIHEHSNGDGRVNSPRWRIPRDVQQISRCLNSISFSRQSLLCIFSLEPETRRSAYYTYEPTNLS